MEFWEFFIIVVIAEDILVKGDENECQPRWINWNDKCYWTSHNATDEFTRTFADATTDCEQRGALLLHYSEEDVNLDFLSIEKASNSFLEGGMKFWVKNRSQESFDDEPARNAERLQSCSYFAPIEDDDSHVRLKLGFDHCLMKHNYICEKSLKSANRMVPQALCPSCEGTKAREKRSIHNPLFPRYSLDDKRGHPLRGSIFRPPFYHDSHFDGPFGHDSHFDGPFGHDPFRLPHHRLARPFRHHILLRPTARPLHHPIILTPMLRFSQHTTSTPHKLSDDNRVSTDEGTSCDEGDFEYSGACFYLEEETRPWQEAMNDCRSTKGGNLAYVYGEAEMEIVIGKLNTIRGTVLEMWTNLQYENINDLNFNNTSTNDNDSLEWLCASSRYDQTNQTLVLNFQSCLQNLSALCKYEKRGQNEVTASPGEIGKGCRNGWLHVHGSCFKYFPEKLNKEASSTCKQFEADLMHFEDPSHIKSLMNVFLNLLNDSQHEVWIKNEFIKLKGSMFHIIFNHGLCKRLFVSSKIITTRVGRCINEILPFICQSSEIMFIANTQEETTIITTTNQEVIAFVSKSDTTNAPTILKKTPCSEKDAEWLRFGDFCYKFHFASKGSKTWEQSRYICEKKFSYLASVTSDEESSWLAHQSGLKEGFPMWIGGKLRDYISFQWHDKTPFDYTNWDEGEPNSAWGGETCIMLYTDPKGKWTDDACNLQKGYICKKPAFESVPVITIIGGCPQQWFKMDDKCVRYFHETTTFRGASNKCHDQAKGGSLVSIHSEKHFFFLYSLITSLQNVWIGMRYSIIREKFVWEDNAVVRYLRWGRNEPTTDGFALTVFSSEYEGCVQIKLDDEQQEPGFWHDVGCYGYAEGFLCQIPVDLDLPEPEFPFGTKCSAPFEDYYSFRKSCYQLVNKSLSWKAADAECLKMGTRLVSIGNEAEHSYLWNQFGKTRDYWIGLHYDSEEGNDFMWTDGWPVLFDKWQTEPGMDLNTISCVSMNSRTGKWTVRSCSQVKPFICEHSEDFSKKEGCPPEQQWIDFGGDSCYKVELPSKSWPEASHKCLHFGGHLVSLHSLEDMKTLQKFIDSFRMPMWIGAIKLQRGGFGWSDNSPFIFTNWASKEATNASEDLDLSCVQMTLSGLWHRLSCDTPRHYVCQVSKEHFKSGTTQDYVPDLTTTTQLYSRIFTDSDDSDGNFYSSSQSSHQTLSSGAIGGILTLIFLVVGIVCFAAVTFYRSREKLSNHLANRGFDNVIYKSENTTVLDNVTSTHEERECILETEEDLENEHESQLSPKSAEKLYEL